MILHPDPKAMVLPRSHLAMNPHPSHQATMLLRNLPATIFHPDPKAMVLPRSLLAMIFHQDHQATVLPRSHQAMKLHPGHLATEPPRNHLVTVLLRNLIQRLMMSSVVPSRSPKISSALPSSAAMMLHQDQPRSPLDMTSLRDLRAIDLPKSLKVTVLPRGHQATELPRRLLASRIQDNPVAIALHRSHKAIVHFRDLQDMVLQGSPKISELPSSHLATQPKQCCPAVKKDLSASSKNPSSLLVDTPSLSALRARDLLRAMASSSSDSNRHLPAVMETGCASRDHPQNCSNSVDVTELLRLAATLRDLRYSTESFYSILTGISCALKRLVLK